MEIDFVQDSPLACAAMKHDLEAAPLGGVSLAVAWKTLTAF
ncbi:MAG: hypothetical protein ABR555_05030 [Pyrinomonadaceae bacterium]